MQELYKWLLDLSANHASLAQIVEGNSSDIADLRAKLERRDETERERKQRGEDRRTDAIQTVVVSLISALVGAALAHFWR